MEAPQSILLMVNATVLGVTLAKDGEPSHHSFAASMLSFGIGQLILYWGGWYG